MNAKWKALSLAAVTLLLAVTYVSAGACWKDPGIGNSTTCATSGQVGTVDGVTCSGQPRSGTCNTAVTFVHLASTQLGAFKVMTPCKCTCTYTDCNNVQQTDGTCTVSGAQRETLSQNNCP